MTIQEKLLQVQAELKAPKGQFNKFGGYNYRNAEDILEAVKPLLAKEGIALTLSDELVMVGERYYIKATATISDGTDALSVTAYAREEETKKGMDGSQITGASSSYARKYALNGLFCIDDTKDSDATNEHGKDEPRRQETVKPKPPAQSAEPNKPISIEQAKELQTMCREKWGVEGDAEKNFELLTGYAKFLRVKNSEYEEIVNKIQLAK